MATRHVRTADRRAWYAWKLARRLTAASIRSTAWPPPEDDWCRRVYVGHSTRPASSSTAMVVEFEPDLPLDVDATWSARVMLPECCRTAHQSGSMDVELDEPEPDGTVDPRSGRGARLHDVAVRIGQAWADHARHGIESPVANATAERFAVVVPVQQDPAIAPDRQSAGHPARSGHTRRPVAPVAAVAGG